MQVESPRDKAWAMFGGSGRGGVAAAKQAVSPRTQALRRNQFLQGGDSAGGSVLLSAPPLPAERSQSSAAEVYSEPPAAAAEVFPEDVFADADIEGDGVLISSQVRQVLAGQAAALGPAARHPEPTFIASLLQSFGQRYRMADGSSEGALVMGLDLDAFCAMWDHLTGVADGSEYTSHSQSEYEEEQGGLAEDAWQEPSSSSYGTAEPAIAGSVALRSSIQQYADDELDATEYLRMREQEQEQEQEEELSQRPLSAESNRWLREQEQRYEEEEQAEAAVLMQKVYRGHRARQFAAEEQVRSWEQQEREAEARRHQLQRQPPPAARPAAATDWTTESVDDVGFDTSMTHLIQEGAAISIQATWRGRKTARGMRELRSMGMEEADIRWMIQSGHHQL